MSITPLQLSSGGLSARDRRALMILVPSVAVILLLNYAILPALDSGSGSAPSSASIELSEKKLRKYRQLNATMPAQQHTVGELVKALDDAEKGLVGGQTVALQGAEVEHTVRDIANGQGITLRAVEFTQPKNVSSDYTTLGISTSFTVGIDQLTAFLNGLAASPKILSVDQIRLAASNSPATPTSAARKQVNVNIVISGVSKPVPVVAPAK
jgi:hypothetical protein